MKQIPTVQKIQATKTSITALGAIPICAEVATENLMPYGALAKAIFVKANGLCAYHASVGLLRQQP